MNHFAKELLTIVGSPDGSGGVNGVTVVSGFLARCIIDELGMDPKSPLHAQVWEHPVRVSRQGGLEIWVNGWYTEGSPIRKIIHNAVRRYEELLTSKRQTGFVH